MLGSGFRAECIAQRRVTYIQHTCKHRCLLNYASFSCVGPENWHAT